MANINEPRTIRNTQYLQQIQEVSVDQFNNFRCEEGALVKLGEVIYIGISGVWQQLFPPLNAFDNLAWQESKDTQYTLASPFNFSENTTYDIPNNAGINNYVNGTFYKQTTHLYTLAHINGTWILTIAFKAHLNTNNGHMELFLEKQSDSSVLFSEVFNFPKGNGVEHIFTKSFEMVSDLDLVQSGFKVRFTTSHSGSIYSAYSLIQNIQVHD